MDMINEQKQVIDKLCISDHGDNMHKWYDGECTGKKCIECGKIDGVLRTMHLFYNGRCQQCGLFEEQENLI